MDLAMFTQVAEITDSLFLSSAAAVKADKIRKLGITHVINVTMDIPNLKMPNVESIQIHVDDMPTAHLGLYFDRCADKIDQDLTMQRTSQVTSRPRQRMMSRSRSLAFPLTDIDHAGSSDEHGTPDSPPSDRSNGFVSSMLIVDNGSIEEELNLCEQGKHPKKSLRRQKSLAELFGMALYKSKVHLHELFSRRERPAQTVAEKARDKPISDWRPLEETEASGTRTEEVGVETRTLPSCTSMSGSETATPPKLVPREAVVVGGTNGKVPSLNKAAKQLKACRVPEELFCVTRELSAVERPTSPPEKNVLHSRHAHDSKNTSTPQAARKMSVSDRDSKPKMALRKSNSDSLWHLRRQGQEPGASLPKAPLQGAPRCVHRPPSSSAVRPPTTRSLFSRDSKVGVLTTSHTPPTLSSTVAGNCISPIVEWLWLGSVEAAHNEPLLCSLKVDALVDITNLDTHCVPVEKKTTCPCACQTTHFRTKLKLAVDDIEWENIDQYFADANAFISGWRERGSRVLVVSYHGKSRGPAFVVQHLMHYFHIPLDRALAHVRSRRPQTRLNPGFLRVLQRLDKRLAEQRDFTDLSVPQFPPPEQALGPPKTAWDEC